MSYPVLSIVPEVREKLNHHRIVIVEAPPGAGKSTILPLQLMDEPWLRNQKVILLEPRRLAARSVAMRMADLRGEEAGEAIGYRVRFESRVSKDTRLEVVTEGILTRILQHDNALEGTGLVIFDEFHERSLQADLGLALTMEVMQVLREDLRILIMSATLDTQKLSEQLSAPVVRSAGKQYPVDVRFVPPPPHTPIPVQMVKAISKALKETTGDILAFLPGAGEIRRAAEILEAELSDVLVLPLYGDLNFQKQQQAILPDRKGRRKIVLATSIAETSLTIEGVTVVVDSGYARVPRFDPRSGFTRLETVPVTRDAAEQRKGRAGRLGPGTCYRLWSQAAHAQLVAARTPEILEADLAPLMLELAEWNVKNVSDLTWVTPPPAGAVSQALALLQDLGAVDGTTITARGREMLRLPTHPRIAHMLLEAREEEPRTPGSLALATDIAALLEERDPMPRGTGADLSLRVELLRRWRKGNGGAELRTMDRIERLALAWRQLFNLKPDNGAVADTEVGRWLMAAYPERIGKQVEKHSPRYKMSNGRMARLIEHDPLQGVTWLAIAQVDAGFQEGKIFLAAPVNERDLRLLAVEKEIVSWDAAREMVTSAAESRIGNLTLSSRPLSPVPDEKRIAVLCAVIREHGLGFLGWGDDQRAWQARVNSLRRWRPEENWPETTDESLLERLETWLPPFVGGLYKRAELQKLDLTMILNTLLPWELNAKFQRCAPPRLEVPSGSMIRLQYFMDGRPPVMEVRLQEVFGMLETPSVNEGRNRIMMHLLSPGFKPVQVTQDLESFWNNTYPEVRKELRARYPRHAWPEDPWTAQAIRGARRRV